MGNSFLPVEEFRMIEKRFTWIKKDVYAPKIVITDSLTGKDLTPTDCYELLNGLSDENKQLKKENENLKHTIEQVCKAWYLK